VSVRKTDKAKIDKYLKGKLDSRAMYDVERDAQNDPFLMDALDGFEAAGADQDINMADLKNRLAERVAEKKDRSILLWRVLPLAACLLLMLGIGYLFLDQHKSKPQYANNAHQAKPAQIQPNSSPAIKKADTLLAMQPINKTGSRSPSLSRHIRKHADVNTEPSIDTSKLIAAVEPAKKSDPVVGSEFVDKEKVQDVPVKNTEQLLQGKVAGLNIQNNKTQPATYGRADGRSVAAAPQKLPDSLATDRRLAEVVIRGYVKRTREETTGSSYIITGKDQNKAAERIPIGKIPGKLLPINPPAPKSKVEAKCNENAAFKDQFFSDITVVEKYMLEKDEGTTGTVTYDQFFDAIRFIAKRAPTSVKPNKKTHATYADSKAFRSDKDKWLEWYENNKCNGLK
jgi:hypothetical protein